MQINIFSPIIINAAVVIIGEKNKLKNGKIFNTNIDSKNKIPTTMEVKPVLAPLWIAIVLSKKIVGGDVNNNGENILTPESTNNDFSPCFDIFPSANNANFVYNAMIVPNESII